MRRLGRKLSTTKGDLKGAPQTRKGVWEGGTSAVQNCQKTSAESTAGKEKDAGRRNEDAKKKNSHPYLQKDQPSLDLKPQETTRKN